MEILGADFVDWICDGADVNKPFNRLIADNANWSPINFSQSAADANWRPAGERQFGRL